MPAAPATLENLLLLAQQLPSSPQTYGRLSQLLRDANSSLDDIVELIKTDTALATQVLRVSNSAYYGMSAPAKTLEEAINRLGSREVYRVVGAATANQLFQQKVVAYSLTGAQLGENSIATALAMEQLARPARIEPQLAYTLGLLRSVGKLTLNAFFTRERLELCAPWQPTDPPLLDWEAKVFGLTSPEVTVALLQKWKFADELIEGVRQHLTPKAGAKAAALLNLAGWIANELNKGLKAEASYWAITPLKLQIAGVSEEEVYASVMETRTELNALRSALKFA